jgi:ubiquinol-cytochrome c reductase cytochrome b subunit
LCEAHGMLNSSSPLLPLCVAVTGGQGGLHGGGFTVSNATLNRFFSLHYLLPFILAALAAVHLVAKDENGSGNPLGISSNADRLVFHPYFTFKDLVTVLLYLTGLAAFVFYAPNALGHSDNYQVANPMSTPASIVPEWYLLAFYAILRSIPNKLTLPGLLSPSMLG